MNKSDQCDRSNSRGKTSYKAEHRFADGTVLEKRVESKNTMSDRIRNGQLPQEMRCRMLIKLASMGARGSTEPVSPELDAELLRTAIEQNVLPFVACALLKTDSECDAEGIREQCLEILRTSASMNMLRQQRVLHLIREMEDAGYRVCVLKGLSVARLYAYPESREAIDTDLLIDPTKEKEVYSFLRERGFLIKGRRLTANDGGCEHAKYGKIEVHTSLYPELTETVWKNFLDLDELQKEKHIRVRMQDGSFETLGHTDQLVFLTLHMIKHFVESGLSIRMMLDVALHFSAHHQEIDSEYFWHVMRALKFDGCVSAILWIMIQDGEFCEEDFPGIESPVQERINGILFDLEKGGYMGASEIHERHESGMEYYRQRMLKRKSDVQYWSYMLVWKLRSGLQNIFPTYQRLKRMYPLLERHPVFAPAIWAFQMVYYPVVKIKSGVLRRDIRGDKRTMSAESEQRMKLFENLGML